MLKNAKQATKSSNNGGTVEQFDGWSPRRLSSCRAAFSHQSARSPRPYTTATLSKIILPTAESMQLVHTHIISSPISISPPIHHLVRWPLFSHFHHFAFSQHGPNLFPLLVHFALAGVWWLAGPLLHHSSFCVCIIQAAPILFWFPNVFENVSPNCSKLKNAFFQILTIIGPPPNYSSCWRWSRKFRQNLQIRFVRKSFAEVRKFNATCPYFLMNHS